MSEFNPGIEIRLSDIDNLLQESIFETTNGDKLVEYIKKKRGGGRARLHDIFERAAGAVQRPNFNFDIDASDLHPLPPSPEENDGHVPAESSPRPVESQIPPDGKTVHNGNGMVETSSTSAKKNPMVVLANKSSLNMVAKSPATVKNLSRQVLINQYQRSNSAKCEMLRQLATSTPIPGESSTYNRISTFTTSISPILEGNSPEDVPNAVSTVPVHVKEPAQPLNNKEDVPVTDKILVPSSQAISAPENTPQKVIVIRTQTVPPPSSPEVIVPETPSPAKESPKAANHTLIQPRRLCNTFDAMDQVSSDRTDGNLTSDDDEAHHMSGDENMRLNVSYAPASKQSPDDSLLLKSILKDRNTSQNRRSEFRVSFSQQLVHEREISPAPSIPSVDSNSDSDSEDSSNESDCDEEEFQVVDEVYSDHSEENDAVESQKDYDEYKKIHDELLEYRNQQQTARPESPLIDVVEEQPVQWYETRTPRHDDVHRGKSLVPPTTGKKDNKTNLQLVDIITDWDDEEEEEVEPEAAVVSFEIPETQVATQRSNETNRDAMDISSSNMEESAERIVELLPPPPGFGEIESDENAISPTTSPTSPATQFSDSAKHRFLRENEEALISRIQNELPVSQQPPSSSAPINKSYEKVPETLVEIAQSFRDQPPQSVAPQELRMKPMMHPKKRKATVPDPATTSYFETVAKTFAKQTMPPPTTATKRKLYASKVSDEETAPVASRSAVLSVHRETTPAMRNLNVVIQKLTLEDCLEEKQIPSNILGLHKNILSEKHTETAGKTVPQLNNPSVKTSQRTVRQPKVLKSKTRTVAASSTIENTRKDPHSYNHEYSVPMDCSDINSQSSESQESVGRQPLDVPNLRNLEETAPLKQRVNNALNTRDVSDKGDVHSDNSQSDDPNPMVQKNTIKKQNTKSTSPTENVDIDNNQKEIPESARESSGSSMAYTTRSEDQHVRSLKIYQGKTTTNSEDNQNDSSTTNSRDSLTVSNVDRDPLEQGRSSAEMQAERATRMRSTAKKKNSKLKVSRNTENTARKEEEKPHGKSIPKSKEDSQRKRIIKSNGFLEPHSKDSQLDVAPMKQKKKVPTKKNKKLHLVQNNIVESVEANGSLPKNNNNQQIVPEAPSDEILETSDIVLEDEVPRNEILETSDIVLEDEQFSSSRSHSSEKTPENYESPFQDDEGEDNDAPLAMEPKRNKTRATSRKNDHFEKYTTEETEKSKGLPRYLREVEDSAWQPPKHLKEKVNTMRRKLNREKNRSSEEEETVRRSGRTCRIAKQILMTNPLVKSAYDRPNYRPPTVEEILEAERLAQELRKKNRGTRKPPAKVNSKSTETTERDKSKQTANRKRVQHLTHEEEGNIATKRNRLEEASTSTSSLKEQLGTSSEGNSTANGSGLINSSERLIQEKLQAQSWMLKLIADTNQRPDRLPVNPVNGNLVHFTLDHISFQERNGIQYSFFVYSERENYGFLRFSPLAVKKLTKTADFQLKFLILNGKLIFQINGKEIITKGGDFLMLPENSKYSIKNCEEISLLFMVKFVSS
ncbi:uncharacterized protein LOC129777517 isoform X2 [Toxorhynchites rutilus septentrionalis]|uniref:uncharacterized protein LOC129777517 isoform X2 n=1 Tax=Toxorhynchites rutilus septentrionalis TaxID=329112 RepID=UPI00247A717D|nr:uncharacterized protein LOC129777517 isoform X2 [Toxorhynchites rutilus septentrionalis]